MSRKSYLTYNYHLDKPPTIVLERIINSRVGTGGEKKYSLVVENLNYAISFKINAGLEPEGSLCVRADFVLKKGEESADRLPEENFIKKS